MASDVGLTFDEPAIDAAADRLVRQYLSAGTQAVGNTTKRLERRLEAATAAAVPGRFWRAWQSSSYPRSGPAREAPALVFREYRPPGLPNTMAVPLSLPIAY